MKISQYIMHNFDQLNFEFRFWTSWMFNILPLKRVILAVQSSGASWTMKSSSRPSSNSWARTMSPCTLGMQGNIEWILLNPQAHCDLTGRYISCYLGSSRLCWSRQRQSPRWGRRTWRRWGCCWRTRSRPRRRTWGCRKTMGKLEMSKAVLLSIWKIYLA